ncbi:Transcriptional regulator, LysR family protein [Enhygromyxa salina]|uniref:Transcriptional regulator, LysR family protein n=1 Tax=Enhygromyxa salina TaxID=215803 RepID=A0A0C1Z723_9BACT|nr:LysR family transcriptional regulator [Enhygromyxa salina]KIG13439.1 Transcriptional regulator, LysR family protein [Enhygromyxa salina]
MSQLVEIETFVTVVEAGSFAAAGEQLGISSSYASKLITRLEDRLGVRLLHRTTRKLTLTEAGAVYHETCAEGLSLLSHAQDDVTALQATPRGRLRVSLPTNLGVTWLASWIANFGRDNPELSLDVVYLDRAVDLLAEGFDVAVRAGSLDDSSLIAKRLAVAHRLVVASPRYLERVGAPSSPEELSERACLLYSNSPTPAKWSLQAGEQQRTVSVSGPMTANSGAALLKAAICGLGIACLPDFHVAPALADGRIVQVLDAWTWPVPIHALYPSRRHLPAKVRAFIDALAAYMTTPPWLRPPSC